jgi:hypothetical protein
VDSPIVEREQDVGLFDAQFTGRLPLERFQREIVRGTFMMSQGRQWLQISCLDSIFRMLLARRVGIDWEAMGQPAARAVMRKRSLPPGHVPVELAAQQEMVFELWLQLAIWIGQYVYTHDASRLPDNDSLDHFIERRLGLETWTSSTTEEEVSGMKVMFDRYRHRDPYALLGADESIRKFTIPFWIQSDRHWVSGERRRPGVLRDPHGSMMLRLMTSSRDRQALGWQLTITDELCLRVSDILTEIADVDPGYETLPAYRKLIDEYNARHPDATVECLHR